MNPFEATEEQKIVSENIGKVLLKFDEPYWRELDRKGEFPEEYFREAASLGLFSINCPEEYGGLGLGIREVSLAIKETTKICGMSAGDLIMATCIFGIQTIKSFARRHIQEELLPELSAGKHIVSFAITEPEAGVETPAIKTKASLENGRFIINGRKIWITLAHKASLIFILARTKNIEEVKKRTDGLSLILLDKRKMKGNLTVSRIDEISMRPLGSCEVYLDDVSVPDDYVIGEMDKAWDILPTILNAERISTASIGVGLTELLVKKAVEYAKLRKTFSRELGSNQAIQFPLAKAYADAKTAWSITKKAAWEFDNQFDCAVSANVAAYLAGQSAFFAADRAMQTFGGMAYGISSDIERYWRDSRLLRTGPVPEEMVLSFIAQRVLGLQRSY